MNKDDKVQKVLEGLTKKAVDEEKIIEFGWAVYLKSVISPMASQIQIDETRNAFFAGAQHLFASILAVLDPDKEPTERDLRRMDAIAKELSNFVDEYKQSHLI